MVRPAPGVRGRSPPRCYGASTVPSSSTTVPNGLALVPHTSDKFRHLTAGVALAAWRHVHTGSWWDGTIAGPQLENADSRGWSPSRADFTRSYTSPARQALL